MNAEALQAIGLAISQVRSSEAVLQTVVETLAGQDGIALARAWLIGRGDICACCPMRAECPDQERCLHLTASAGAPIQESVEDWSRLDGTFRRFPLGVRKVGHIGATGCAVMLKRTSGPSEWVARPEWAARESISGFAGQPMIFRGQILGVLAVFSRQRFDQKSFEQLRQLADQAAAAVASARAFEEIDSTRRRLELESVLQRDNVEIVGGSLAIANVLSQADLVAPTDANVLVCGEPGTGKELVARRIHKLSLRADRPLIKTDCAAAATEQLESELFGSSAGDAPGRAGRFHAAAGGTVFLDEVSLLSLAVQDRLAREMRQAGSTRVIASTNRDLNGHVDAGHFRAELMHRLAVFCIDVPPLRKRIEDIPRLADHFLRLACRKLGRQAEPLTPDQVRSLKRYEWPGNVTELRQVVERSALISGGGPPRPELLVVSKGPPAQPSADVFTASELKERERGNLETALQRARWRIYGPDGAAIMLGMKPTTLASRMKALGIKRPV